MPCSTSNLGAGFDCIGLALDRYLEASFEPLASGLTVERTGTLGALDVDPAHDVLVAALRERLGWKDVVLHGRIRVTSSIPIGRGLGSSAAARIAGFALGAVSLGERFSATDAWIHATSGEGHPDNAAPCAFGGLVAVAPPVPHLSTLGLSLIRLPLSPSIGWAYAAPAAEVSTEAARRALPPSLERAVVVDSIRRMPALLRGLETGDPALLAIGFGDQLHVPYRLRLIPDGERALRAAVDAGAWAATISGSGSGLIAAGPPGAEASIAAAMGAAFRAGREAAASAQDDGVVAFAVSPDLDGAQILPS